MHWTSDNDPPRPVAPKPNRMPDTVELGQVLVELLTEADELGRQRFVGYWAEGTPDHVKGQVFTTVLAEWIAARQADGLVVIVLNPELVK